MPLVIEKPRNANYAAVVTKLATFIDPLLNCDRLKGALIFGNHVLVGKDTPAGAVGLFFPVETQILREFLHHNNLFRHAEENADTSKKGMFEDHGRVRAVKMRGHKSEGFWIPIESLSYLGVPLDELQVGMEFDSLDGHAICQKYVPRFRSRVGSPDAKSVRKSSKRNLDRLIDGQFKFHYDTENLRRNIDKILPETWISVSTKYHGTSAVFSHILVRRELTWVERLLQRFGIMVQDQEYAITWSSKRVLKGIIGRELDKGNYQSSQAWGIGSGHYYSEDIWGVVAREIRDRVPKGYTVYGEIVGYTTDGAAIQKGYHYGCQPGTHRFLVYRVTCTNVDGRVLELSWLQMKEFCAKYGFEMVEELWYGRACDFTLVALRELAEQWQSRFLRQLEDTYVYDQMCPHNNREVPAEGIVVRVDGLEACEAFKLKSFRFLEFESKSLDAGTVDMETVESEEGAA